MRNTKVEFMMEMLLMVSITCTVMLIADVVAAYFTKF